MTQYKGSQGKWVMHPNGEVVTTVDGKFICLMTKPGILITEEKKCDALLISKSPEMLEFLKKVMNSHPDGNPMLLIEEAKRLYKEATTFTRVKIIHVKWDVEKQDWEKSREEIEQMGRVIKEQYISMASRIDYWVEKSIV